MFDVAKGINAQRKYCAEKGAPHFAPTNGTCWRCNRNIYKEYEHSEGATSYKTGISVERASSELVTGCPHGNISYCD